MGKRKRADINLLDLIPRRAAEYKIDEARIVTVFLPRFRNRLLTRICGRLGRSPLIMITLDEIGSATWLLCDGQRRVAEIASGLEERFGERIEKQRNERLGLFFRQLENAGFISFVNLEECRRAADGDS